MEIFRRGGFLSGIGGIMVAENVALSDACGAFKLIAVVDFNGNILPVEKRAISSSSCQCSR
jgi:hypothetical protein